MRLRLPLLISANPSRVLFSTFVGLLAILFFYLKYRWIDHGLYQREVLPAAVVGTVFLSSCLPQLIRSRWGLRRVGHYLILSRIGEGATSVVYGAKSMLTGRKVAVNVLHGYMREEEENRDGFMNEAARGIGLSNPHLVEIYERGRTEEKAYIAMEYIEGTPLSALIDDGRIFSEDDVLRFTLQILSGLTYLHDNGIIHRDIKSANIRVAEGENVKIMDFGLSKFLFRASVTKPGALVGTLRYMSPEQAVGKSVDPRSDIYSVGVVMYELVTGQLPYESDNEIEIIHKMLNEEPDSPAESGATISPFTDRFIMKALRKSVVERYRDAAEMSHECRIIRRLNQLQLSQEQLLRDLGEIEKQADGDVRWGDLEIAELLLRLGRSYLKSARVGMEATPSSLDECLRKGRKSLEYLELVGDKALLLRTHYLLFRVMSQKRNKREAGKHLRKVFEL